jgi:predicted amidohydrolase
MRVGYVQFAPAFGDKDANLERVEGLLQGAKADLIILPELFATGYIFESREELFDLAESRNGVTFERLKNLSRESGTTIVAGLAERDGDSCYNSAFAFSEGEIVGSYRKVHLFNREKELFTPGDTRFSAFDLEAGRIGLMICFDWIFPEATRLLALDGAQVICHPSNLVLPYCPQAMITRCIENGVFAITANRVGSEARAGLQLEFIGMSQIIGPRGDVLVRSGQEEVVRVIDIQPHQADDKMVTERNHILEDRRPEFYNGLCKGGKDETAPLSMP